MEYLIYLCLSTYIYICCFTIQTETICLQPDVPENGNYISKHTEVMLGNKITYSCKKGFALSKEETVTWKCKSSWQWADRTPFCDPEIQLTDPIVIDQKGEVFRTEMSPRIIIDGNTKTCLSWYTKNGDDIMVSLVRKMIIRTVKIYFKRGEIRVRVSTGTFCKMILNANYSNLRESGQWVFFNCESNAFADKIKIEFTENIHFSMCEVQAYGNTAEGCDLPPLRKIVHGHLQVSRYKALLICDDGFTSHGSNELDCDGNTWLGEPLLCEEVLCGLALSLEDPGVQWIYPNLSKKLSIGTIGRLKCSPGFEKVGEPDIISCQKNGTWTKTSATCIDPSRDRLKIKKIVFFTVAIVVMIIIIALLATIICYIRKQKSKEVIVVYQTKSEESVIFPVEREYELPPYEALEPPELPTAPRPLAKLSTMSKCGDTLSTTWKATYVKNNFNHPEVADDTMKSSALYGS